MSSFLFFAGLLIGVLLSPVFIMGGFIIVVGLRLKKNMGKDADKTAFWSNFIAFVWSFAEQAKHIAAKMPAFQKDLTETFGIRPDDGRTT